MSPDSEMTLPVTSANPVFRAIDNAGCGSLRAASILESLAVAGIAEDDPRVATLRARLAACGETEIDGQRFDALVDNCGSLVARAVRGDLVIPDFGRFTAKVRDVFKEVQAIRFGKVADYIPQLARVPDDRFAVSVCTIDGQQLHLGDAEEAFTMQSSCKPLLYGAALEEHGVEAVHRHVGREPSGLSFNELTLNADGLPHNPMINSGAIMTSSLIRRDLPTADRLEFLARLISALSGNQPTTFDTAVWHSERQTADRNFALAHHMRERGAFPPDTDIHATLDYYFWACALQIRASTYATIGATFANGGVCPLTGERVFAEETIKNSLSMMYSCGLYDYSGEFAFSVGIPAKSSVSGVILAVVPNVMGIVVWSPGLDACGNSVRGIAFMKELVSRFNFHNYDGLVDSAKDDPRRVSRERETDNTYRAIYAASIGDINELKRLVARGHNLDTADYDGRTPLHLACAEGQESAVRYLLHQGADVTVEDRWGNTPLADAIRHERFDVQELLTKPQGTAERCPTRHIMPTAAPEAPVRAHSALQ